MVSFRERSFWKEEEKEEKRWKRQRKMINSYLFCQLHKHIKI